MRPQLFLFCIGILCYFQDAFAQTQWIRLDNEKTIIPEYILCSEAGDKYVSVSGRKAILGKKAGEIMWTNLMENNPELRYFIFWDSKTLFFDHSQNLRLYYRTDYFDALFNFQQDRFVLDTSSVNQIDHNFQYKIIYDTLGKSYYFKDDQLFSFLTAYGQSQKIFDKREKIVKAIMVSPSENYVLTQRSIDSLRLYKLNSSDFKTQLLTELHNPAGRHQFAQLTKSGNLFIINGEGLFRFSTQLQQTEKLIIDNALPTPSHTDALYLSKKGELILKIDSLFYYSSNEGEDWLRLQSFAHHFPQLSELVKMEIIDSSNALAILDTGCSTLCIELSETSLGWQVLDPDYSAVNRSLHCVSSSGKIYSAQASCVVEESTDEAKTWKPTLLFGNRIKQIIRDHSKSLFAISSDGNHLYESMDDGNNWLENTTIQQNNPGLVFQSLNSIAPEFIYLEGVYKDSVNGKLIRHIPIVNFGTGWRLLSTAQDSFFRYQIKYDRKNKMIYSLKKPFENPRFYASDHTGASFVLKDEFNKFSRVYSYSINDDGHFFINGHLNGVLDLYVSKDLQKFESVNNGQFGKQIINEIYRFNDRIMLAVNFTSFIYISVDGGTNWSELNEGLGLLEQDVKMIGGIAFGKADKVYASMIYDGLYKLDQAIVATNQWEKDAELSIIPNPLRHEFEIKCDDLNINATINFFVYTLDGRLVSEFTSKGPDKRFEFPELLAPGLYHVRMYIDHNKEYHATIIKQ